MMYNLPHKALDIHNTMLFTLRRPSGFQTWKQSISASTLVSVRCTPIFPRTCRCRVNGTLAVSASGLSKVSDDDPAEPLWRPVPERERVSGTSGSQLPRPTTQTGNGYPVWIYPDQKLPGRSVDVS